MNAPQQESDTPITDRHKFYARKSEVPNPDFEYIHADVCADIERQNAALQAQLSELKHDIEARSAEAERDRNRLDEIAENYWTLEAFDMPTGGGDYDVGWRVTELRQGGPGPITVSVEYSDNPRDALDSAISALAGAGGDK